MPAAIAAAEDQHAAEIDQHRETSLSDTAKLMTSVQAKHAEQLDQQRAAAASDAEKASAELKSAHEKHAAELEAQSDEEWKALAVQASICGVALINAAVCENVAQIPGWGSVLLYGIAIVSGAWDAAIDAWMHKNDLQDVAPWDAGMPGEERHQGG